MILLNILFSQNFTYDYGILVLLAISIFKILCHRKENHLFLTS
jgi:hypothetical protein